MIVYTLRRSKLGNIKVRKFLCTKQNLPHDTIGHGVAMDQPSYQLSLHEWPYACLYTKLKETLGMCTINTFYILYTVYMWGMHVYLYTGTS